MSYCLPVVAAALAVAGAGASVAGQQKAKSAMNRKTMEELLRQKGISDKASNEFASSLAQSGKETADTQIQEGQTEREGGYRAAQSVPLDFGAPLVGGTSPAVNLQDQAQLANSNRSRAKLGSYDKWQLDQVVKNVRAGQQQGLFGQQAQRSQAILPMELQDASHAGDNLQNWGTALGLASTIASMGSMAGLGAGANAGTAASQSALYAGQGPVTAGWAAANPGLMSAGYTAQAANAAKTASALSLISGLGNSGLGMYNKPTYGITR